MTCTKQLRQFAKPHIQLHHGYIYFFFGCRASSNVSISNTKNLRLPTSFLIYLLLSPHDFLFNRSSIQITLSSERYDVNSHENAGDFHQLVQSELPTPMVCRQLTCHYMACLSSQLKITNKTLPRTRVENCCCHDRFH